MAVTSTGASNDQNPPAIADGDKGAPKPANQSISYNSAKSNTAGLAATPTDPSPAAGRKGRGICIGRQGGSY